MKKQISVLHPSQVIHVLSIHIDKRLKNALTCALKTR